jgi:hypothetical protein
MDGIIQYLDTSFVRIVSRSTVKFMYIRLEPLHMSDAEHRFWTESDRYHDLAMEFERNVERDHPEYVTSRGLCACLDYCYWCTWGASNVDYYQYTGPSVHNI